MRDDDNTPVWVSTVNEWGNKMSLTGPELDRKLDDYAAEAAKQQARRDAEICREQALCSEDEAHDNSVAAQDGDGTSCNKGTQHCAQAIEREAGL